MSNFRGLGILRKPPGWVLMLGPLWFEWHTVYGSKAIDIAYGHTWIRVAGKWRNRLAYGGPPVT